MTPRLRRKNERARRIRSWAAPFVLTVAMAPAACKKAPREQEVRTQNPPAIEWDAAGAAPAAADAATAKAPPKPPVWSESNAPVVARLEFKGTDECQWMFRADCKPDTKCNPPAPRAVVCPDEVEPGKMPDIELLADGECRITMDPDCPMENGVVPPCNPPAPQKLDCPADAPPKK